MRFQCDMIIVDPEVSFFLLKNRFQNAPVSDIQENDRPILKSEVFIIKKSFL